jgi:hypothetical protein
MASRKILNHPRRGSYLAAAALLVLVSLFASSYGLWSVAPYALAAAFCVVQFFLPTVAGWFLIAASFLVISAYYLLILVGDIVRLGDGERPSAMLDFGDSLMFLGFLVVLLAVTFWLLFSLPISIRHRLQRLVQPNKSFERTREG